MLKLQALNQGNHVLITRAINADTLPTNSVNAHQQSASSLQRVKRAPQDQAADTQPTSHPVHGIEGHATCLSSILMYLSNKTPVIDRLYAVVLQHCCPVGLKVKATRQSKLTAHVQPSLPSQHCGTALVMQPGSATVAGATCSWNSPVLLHALYGMAATSVGPAPHNCLQLLLRIIHNRQCTE